MKDRVFSHSDFMQLLARLKRQFGRKPEPEPEDPFAGVRSPNRYGPQSRSGAVALAEPGEENENRSYSPRKL
jgi:hypothetical protein